MGEEATRAEIKSSKSFQTLLGQSHFSCSGRQWEVLRIFALLGGDALLGDKRFKIFASRIERYFIHWPISYCDWPAMGSATYPVFHFYVFT